MSDPRVPKAVLRARVLALRSGLEGAYRARASRAVRERLLTLPEVVGAHAISAFVAVRQEVAITEALRTFLARGDELWLPWVDGPRLHLAKVEDLDRDLAPGWKGVPEPVEDRRSASGPGQLDVAIVPGVAFDRRGHRLGYGGGHFDRLLAALPRGTPVVGCAFAVQVVDEVPAEDHDVPVDVIVTEAEVHRPGA